MKNSLGDLNNILFEQLERLNDDEIMKDPEKAKRENDRAKSMSNIAGEIIKGAAVQLNAIKFKEDVLMKNSELPDVLKTKKPQLLEAK